MSQPRYRWIAERAEPLGDILRRLGLDVARSLASGCVFVERRRVRRATVVQPGQSVEVYPDYREASSIELIGERDGILAIFKPAGVPTEPDRSGARSARTQVADRFCIPEARVHAAGRLDAFVSGVVLMALEARARRHLLDLRRDGRLRRRYVALAPNRGSLEDRSHWDSPVDDRVALTRYAIIGRTHALMLLALEPATGRKHQLRMHAAAANIPLLGDRAYGGSRRWVASDGSVVELRRIALHAAWASLVDIQGARWQPEAPPPSELREIWQDAGGTSECWDAAYALAAVGD
jgi:23S rRNA-/tRNA-specific pseudouridylate synthase